MNPQTVRRKDPRDVETEVFSILGRDRFVETVRKLAKLRKPVTNETILMYAIFDDVCNGYCAAYEGIGKIMSYVGEQYSEGYRIPDMDYVFYLEQLRTEAIRGEQRVSVEEKNVLQLLFYGNYAEQRKEILSHEQALDLIKKAVDCMRFGYLSELVDGSFFDLFNQSLAEFTPLYQNVMRQILPTFEMALGIAYNFIFNVTPTPEKRFWFSFLQSSADWTSGTLPETIEFSEFPQFPAFPKQEEGAVTIFFAPPGKGKSATMYSLSSMAIMKGEIVLTCLNDDSNQLVYAMMPMFGYSRRTEGLTKFLMEKLQVTPTGLPVLILDIVQPHEMEFLKERPLTIYDRIIEISDPRDFEIDFTSLIKDHLKPISEEYGFSKPCGHICVRYLPRMAAFTRATGVAFKQNINLQIAFNIINKFDGWRELNRSIPMRLFLDEISMMAPSQLALAGSDQALLGASLGDMLKKQRRKNLSIDASTQRPLDVITEFRDLATNILFRDLPQAGRAEQSEIDIVLKMMKLKNEILKESVKEINRKMLLRGTHFWFWYHAPASTIDLVWSCPPPHMLEDAKLDPEKLFGLYEKAFGKKLLVDKLEDVPIIQRAERRKRRTDETGLSW